MRTQELPMHFVLTPGFISVQLSQKIIAIILN